MKQRKKGEYEEKKKYVKTEMQNIDHVCITTDAWTSINTDSFLAITCHVVTSDFELKSYTIETYKMSENHTAATISYHLYEAFVEWGIQDKVIAATTDNATNMVSSIKQLHKPVVHVRCFAHTLNFIIKNSLANVCEIHTLREKCRHLVSYFTLSTMAKDKLTEVQKILGIPCHKLILEVQTRWNSSYQMFERLNEQRPAVILLISSLKINLTSLIDTEWELLGKLLPILKPFLLATNEISAEKSVSISKVLMIKKQLDIFLGTFPLNGIVGKLCIELMS